MKARKPLGCLLFCALIYILFAGSLFADEKFYEMGGNKIEFRKSARDKPFLDQRDLAAFSLKRGKTSGTNPINFYIKLNSLHKLHRFLKQNQEPEILLNGKLIQISKIPVVQSPGILFFMGAFEVFVSAKNGIPVQKMLKQSKEISALDTPERSAAILVWVRKQQKLEPGDPGIRLYLAYYYSGRKECEKAGELITLDKGDALNLTLRVLVGNCFSEKELYFEAIKVYTRLYKENNRLLGLVLRSRAYALSHQYPLSLRDLDFALLESPRHFGVYLRRAQLLVKMKRYEEAIRDYKVALKLKPGKSKVYNALARLYISQNRNLQEALQLSLKSRTLSPHSAHYMNTLAEIYLRLGKLDLAQTFTQKALAATGDPWLKEELRARLKKIKLRRR